jgi:hypothetical protein
VSASETVEIIMYCLRRAAFRSPEGEVEKMYVDAVTRTFHYSMPIAE